MKYLGGKSALAKDIARVIHCREDRHRRYTEPFIGGGSAFLQIAPGFTGGLRAGDVHPALMTMWEAAAEGWRPPTGELTKEQYESVKQRNPNKCTPTQAYIGFQCSYMGVWAGGFSNRADLRRGAKGFARIGELLATAELSRAGYGGWDVGSMDVVYCDPPYTGTNEYGGAEGFNSKRFWQTMETWVAYGASVYVSEVTAPPRWRSVWNKRRKNRLKQRYEHATVEERLYVHESQY